MRRVLPSLFVAPMLLLVSRSGACAEQPVTADVWSSPDAVATLATQGAFWMGLVAMTAPRTRKQIWKCRYWLLALLGLHYLPRVTVHPLALPLSQFATPCLLFVCLVWIFISSTVEQEIP